MGPQYRAGAAQEASMPGVISQRLRQGFARLCPVQQRRVHHACRANRQSLWRNSEGVQVTSRSLSLSLRALAPLIPLGAEMAAPPCLRCFGAPSPCAAASSRAHSVAALRDCLRRSWRRSDRVGVPRRFARPFRVKLGHRLALGAARAENCPVPEMSPPQEFCGLRYAEGFRTTWPFPRESRDPGLSTSGARHHTGFCSVSRWSWPRDWLAHCRGKRWAFPARFAGRRCASPASSCLGVLHLEPAALDPSKLVVELEPKCVVIRVSILVGMMDVYPGTRVPSHWLYSLEAKQVASKDQNCLSRFRPKASSGRKSSSSAFKAQHGIHQTWYGSTEVATAARIAASDTRRAQPHRTGLWLLPFLSK
eukprot:scaffold1809_cov228-Pinguiococcus_pyrenoidosus.AAC.7